MSRVQEKRAESDTPFIRSAVRIGGHPPMALEPVAHEEPDRDLGIADVEGEQHVVEAKSRESRVEGQAGRVSTSPDRTRARVPSSWRTRNRPSSLIPSAIPGTGELSCRPLSQSRRSKASSSAVASR